MVLYISSKEIYIEEVYWGRDNIIKLVCTFNDENHEKIIPYYELILNSFAWEKASEIAEGYVMYYNEDAKFEVLVPDSWMLGASGNSVVATDGEDGATETISLLESILDEITATDMSGLSNTG